MKINQAAGELLRSLRHKKGKSIVTLAEATGITIASLSRYETGKQRLSVEVFSKLLCHFDTPIRFKPTSLSSIDLVADTGKINR
jgi:transcriptional regulator with XRE-family HTH domain